VSRKPVERRGGVLDQPLPRFRPKVAREARPWLRLPATGDIQIKPGINPPVKIQAVGIVEHRAGNAPAAVVDVRFDSPNDINITHRLTSIALIVPMVSDTSSNDTPALGVK
jgi:hypothetical protein